MSLLIFAGVILLLFWLAKAVFKVLAFAAPALIILSLIINYKTAVNFFKSIINRFSTNWPYAVLMVLLCVFAFPLVAGYLFFKSILDRNVGKVRQKMDEQRYGIETEFEEMESEIRMDEFEESSTKKSNPYDELLN